MQTYFLRWDICQENAEKTQFLFHIDSKCSDCVYFYGVWTYKVYNLLAFLFTSIIVKRGFLILKFYCPQNNFWAFFVRHYDYINKRWDSDPHFIRWRK